MGAGALDRAREDMVSRLEGEYACGHLSLLTFEHRVQVALAARGLDELSATIWDLPAVAVNRLQALRTRLLGLEPASQCSHLAFKTVPELVISLHDAPRTLRIGRDPACEVVLSYPAISRHHAVLSVRGGACTVRDIGSTNGICLNDHPILTSRLRPGDVLSFADAVHATVC
jgi:hypothetical protein